MLDKRYQVFITTSGKEMQPERMVVSQTLIGMGFFSWGLENRTPLTTAFARRQIDDCDYVLLLLGNQYGEQSVSGVSYMHLEYIYAITKQKPMIVFMYEQPESCEISLQENKTELQNRFQEFRQLLQKEVEQVVYYRTLRDLEVSIRSHLPQMLERYPCTGWVRPKSMQQLQDEIDHLKAKLKQSTAQHVQTQDPFLSLPRVQFNDNYRFEYRMHAYQDGNFKEINAIHQISWIDLLKILADQFIQAAPEEHFSKLLNHYLNETGLLDVQQQMPRAHAVSRCQIDIRALHTIKQQMRQNDWIVPVGRDERQRMLWKMTEKSYAILKHEAVLGRSPRII